MAGGEKGTLAVICEEDPVFTLSAWERALPALEAHGYRVEHFFLAPCRMGSHQGFGIPRYYLETFGAATAAKLAAFAILARIARIAGFLAGRRAAGFRALCRRRGVSCIPCPDPNETSVAERIRTARVDLLFVMCGFVLDQPLLQAPRLGVLNKHAGLLPADRGLLPGFWAVLEGRERGVSFHTVTKAIDRGRIVLQEQIPLPPGASLVRFYAEVFRRFHEHLPAALDALAEGRIRDPIHPHPPSYHGLPGRKEYRAFRRRGGAVIRISDLPLALRL